MPDYKLHLTDELDTKIRAAAIDDSTSMDEILTKSLALYFVARDAIKHRDKICVMDVDDKIKLEIIGIC